MPSHQERWHIYSASFWDRPEESLSACITFSADNSMSYRLWSSAGPGESPDVLVYAEALCLRKLTITSMC